jgi:hypothetical protein
MFVRNLSICQFNSQTWGTRSDECEDNFPLRSNENRSINSDGSIVRIAYIFRLDLPQIFTFIYSFV